MIPVELRWRIAELERAEAAVEKAIVDRMDEVARRLGLDEMIITHHGTTYKRGGKSIESKQLAELDVLYCDNIHEAGPVGFWTPEKGWDT